MMAGRGLLAMAVLVLSGCSHLAYYAQSIHGHLELLARERPIDELLADDGVTEPDLWERLATVRRIRDFATAELGLPDNDSYRSYAAVERPYVVWSVVATPELSLAPVTWCFPFAGCVAYRGYFDEADARDFAAGQRAAGREVHVGGVPAYSTLGWLDDPLPSTVIHWPEHRLAGLMFHELAHQVVYVEDDTAFNEAFATTVQREGVRRWLRARGERGVLERYAAELAAEADLLARLAGLRAELEAIYGSGRSRAARRAAKEAARTAFGAGWQDFRARHGARALPFRDWFSTPPNNARLASAALYHDLVPAFEVLLASAGGDMEAFYARVRALGTGDRAARRIHLRALDRDRTGAGAREGLVPQR